MWIYILRMSVPTQVEDTSSIVMQAIDLPSAAIQLNLHSVSVPTSELNLHTLDLSLGSVHSVHTRSVTPIY